MLNELDDFVQNDADTAAYLTDSLRAALEADLHSKNRVSSGSPITESHRLTCRPRFYDLFKSSFPVTGWNLGGTT
jgi:hypothetical protein